MHRLVLRRVEASETCDAHQQQKHPEHHDTERNEHQPQQGLAGGRHVVRIEHCGGAQMKDMAQRPSDAGHAKIGQAVQEGHHDAGCDQRKIARSGADRSIRQIDPEGGRHASDTGRPGLRRLRQQQIRCADHTVTVTLRIDDRNFAQLILGAEPPDFLGTHLRSSHCNRRPHHSRDGTVQQMFAGVTGFPIQGRKQTAQAHNAPEKSVFQDRQRRQRLKASQAETATKTVLRRERWGGSENGAQTVLRRRICFRHKALPVRRPFVEPARTMPSNVALTSI